MKINDEAWNDLAGMLRSEIEGYGRLFYLLESQREQFLKNDLNGLLSINDDLNAHSNSLQKMRQARELKVSDLSPHEPESSRPPSIRALLDYIPNEVVPLFEELLKEINRLVHESRRKLQQNQMLLRRCREIGHKFLCLINPEEAEKSKVYSPTGQYQASGVQTPVARRYQTHA